MKKYLDNFCSCLRKMNYKLNSRDIWIFIWVIFSHSILQLPTHEVKRIRHTTPASHPPPHPTYNTSKLDVISCKLPPPQQQMWSFNRVVYSLFLWTNICRFLWDDSNWCFYICFFLNSRILLKYEKLLHALHLKFSWFTDSTRLVLFA